MIFDYNRTAGQSISRIGAFIPGCLGAVKRVSRLVPAPIMYTCLVGVTPIHTFVPLQVQVF